MTYLTPREVAERYRVSINTVYSWCKTGVFRSVKVGAVGSDGNLLAPEIRVVVAFAGFFSVTDLGLSGHPESLGCMEYPWNLFPRLS